MSVHFFLKQSSNRINQHVKQNFLIQNKKNYLKRVNRSCGTVNHTVKQNNENGIQEF